MDSRRIEHDSMATKLGTFGGVFTPSLLTILGLVLFLRLGFVTGSVGLVSMIGILGLATAVSLLTSLSLAAIATNLRVGVGGVYFLISRTLGPAFGGAIGIVLYLAMSVSVAFYTIGLGEAVASVLGRDDPIFPRVVAAFVVIGLLGLAWLGADIATRLQYVVMVCLAVSIVGYFAGVVPDLDIGLVGDNLGRPSGDGAFWASFALFFPAITGFTQGVAMSGDLRDPSRSITVGTFAAIVLSTIVYLVVIISFVMVVPLGELRDDTAIMRRLAITPAVIDVGVIAATLSSAIASILGAPRTLQRLAADRLVPQLSFFAVGHGASSNPRRAATLSAVIAWVTIAAGDLNVVAPIISMFFLASYGLINYATYSEARAANTSFRPRFRWFDWRLSLLGTFACLGAILAIDPLAGALAGAAVFALYRMLDSTAQEARFVDSTKGFHLAQVRTHLSRMGDVQAEREWRPCSVVFASRDPERRRRAIEVASWIEGGAGFTTVARIVAGRGPVARKRAERINLELHQELANLPGTVYGRVLVASDLTNGVSAMLQAHGIGAVRPNLALFSWYDPNEPNRSNAGDYEMMVQTAVRYGCSVGVLSAPEEQGEPQTEAPSADAKRASKQRYATIVVWWTDDRTGQLLALLGWLMTRSSSWSGASISVHVAMGPAPDHARRVRQLLEDARIPATVVGSVEADSCVEKAGAADFLLAPLRLRKGEALGPGDIPIDQLVGSLGRVMFVQAAVEVGLDVQPDDNGLAELAEARERAEAATRRAADLDEAASSLMVRAEMLRLDYEATGREPDDALDDAITRSKNAHRQYLDARARADEAWRLVNEIDPTAAAESVDPNLWLEAETGSKQHFPQK